MGPRSGRGSRRSELAKLDLDDVNFRLRRVAGRASWDWNAADESELAQSFMELLEPLRKQLKLDKDKQSDDVLKALWAIYQQPLRLALIKALLPPSTANTTDNLVVAIEADIQPKFSLILKSK
jgi:hypothetical protein